MAYLRQIKKVEFFGKNNKEADEIYLTKAVNLYYELACLKTYLEIIKVIQHQVERHTSLDEDLQIINDSNKEMPFNHRMALIYRSERKKVLRS